MNKKQKRDKWAKDFKLYNIIMENIWKFIGTVLIGVCLGYLTTRKSETDDNYMLIFIILFFLIGIFNFFLNIYKEHKKLEKREALRKKLEEQPKEVQEEPSDENEEANQ